MDKFTSHQSSWGIRFLSFLLFVLFSWLFSFIIGDLDDIGRPDRTEVFEQYVDMDLNASREEVQLELRQMDKKIATTVRSLENIKIASGGETNESLVSFSASLIDQEAQKKDLLLRLQSIESDFQPQHKKFMSAWDHLWRDHRFDVAVYKLLLVIPAFLLGAWVRSRNRASALRPIYTAFLASSFLFLGIIANDHFPEIVFKYIAIFVGLAIVLAMLVHLLRRVSSPKDLDLLKIRREAYAKDICSNCAFPMSREGGKEYICPGCGTGLFGTCGECGAIRHSLLPYCGSCGAS